MAKKKQIELTREEKLQNALVPKEEQPYKIPNNWCWVRLDFLLKEICNGTTIKQNKEGKTARVTRIESLQNNTIDFNRIGNIVNESLIKDKDWYIEGDIIVSHINSIEHVGKSAVITRDMLPLVHGMNLLRLRLNNICNSQFFQLYTRTTDYKKSIVNRVNRAVNQVSINQKQLCSLEIPITNLKEQQRIVNIIESLFTKLDRAKELIENTLAQFEQNKMAILHKAFTGELTVKWRKENNIDLSSWENGILMDFCKINPKKINTKEFDDDMIVSFIPMPCVSDIWGKIVKKELRKLGEVKKGYTNFCEGDVLFAKITPCMENGKSAIVDKLENDIGFGSTEFYVLRCDENKLNNKYLHYFVRQKTFRDEAKGEMTGAVGQQRVPKTFLENYKMKVPTIEEQQEIVNILDKLLAKYNKIKNLKQQLEKIELLKKAILAKAFRGELGTNNPDEESAENLLKEILAEK